jgi:DNA topoisomerase-2
MIMTDQDHDGSHIKGLLFNIFQSMWSSLYKMDGFLSSMLTPIIKASNTKNEIIEFYNMTDYEKWSETDIAKKGWKIKYYKGLGTSNDQEAKEYFKNMKKITYKYTEESDEHIDLAFNKKRADDRKEWLSNYNKNDILDYTDSSVNYETFIDKELIHFSNRDLQRSINHMCDGLKESTRKILFACFKRKLYTNEIKVAQLSGYVSEVSAYHHGEASLQQAIVGMAQIFVGNNNINLLCPNGQFGSRTLSNGSDASSPRYIYTLLSKLSRTIFREDDINILNYQEDDGQQIEPEYYIPIIPMILVNGGLGIGTGYSTNVPQFNPTDLINISKLICEAIKMAQIKTETEEDLERIYDTIDLAPIDELVPYYLGFKGVIEKNEKDSYVSKGIYKWIDENTVEITELPIGTWTDDYKEYLETMIVNGTNQLKSIENHYTSKNIRFILHFNAGAKQTIGDKFETLFKLSSSKNLNMNNMHLFSEKGAIKRYDTTTCIIKEWAEVRIRKYFERKNYKVKILEKDFNILSAKIKFIIDVIEGRIIIMNKKLTDVAIQLENAGYSKIYKDDTDVTETETDDNIKGYRYLISMPISQLTVDRKLILEKEVEELNNKLNNLKNTNIEDIWLTELNELEEAWKEHKDAVELDYENDKNGIVNKSGKAKTAKKKK